MFHSGYYEMNDGYRQHPMPTAPAQQVPTSQWGPALQSWLQGLAMSLQPAPLSATGVMLSPTTIYQPGVSYYENPGAIAQAKYLAARDRLNYLYRLPIYEKLKPEVYQEMYRLSQEIAYLQKVMQIYGVY